MAISTYDTRLVWGTTPYGLSKKIAIKDFPDLDKPPDTLPTTTLEDAIETFILGRKSNGALEFTGNFTKAEYLAIEAGADTNQYYAIEFGDDTVFRWQGQHSVYMMGAGDNEVLQLKIVLAPAGKPTISSLGLILVSCADAAGAGETTVTVTPAAASGYKYMYQVGETLTAPAYEADVSGWTDLATNPDDIATTNGYIIGVALVATATEEALAYGEATAVVA